MVFISLSNNPYTPCKESPVASHTTTLKYIKVTTVLDLLPEKWKSLMAY